MPKKAYRVGLITFVCVIAVGLIAFLCQKHKTNSQAALMFAQMKAQCAITDKSPFRDKDLDFQFQFPNNVVVCEISDFTVTNNKSIALWKKSAFYNSNPNQAGFFGQGIIAAIEVNPLPGLPKPKEIAAKAETLPIANRSVTVRTVYPPSCTENEKGCPQAQIAEFTENGNTYQLQEFTANAGLFQSFTFSSSSQKK